MSGTPSLEDEFGDVVAKARRGLGLVLDEAARMAGLTPDELARVERYEYIPREAVVRGLAAALGLAPDRLWASARRQYRPVARDGQHRQIAVTTWRLGAPYATNAYLVTCRRTGASLLIDPGADAETLVAGLAASAARVERILLTHGHGDHVGALDAASAHTGAPAHIHPADRALLGLLAARVCGELADNMRIAWGSQALVVRHLPGHTPGSVCLLHDEAAFVGDALFAGSIGSTKDPASHARLRQGIAAQLLSRPPGLCLYPGHGPATTVAEERAHNPFFA